VSTFIAKYWGECPNCNEQMKGTLVEYDETNQLVHAFCTTVPDASPNVCPTCFLELPKTGECEYCATA
jgi:hypothetical protein